jgi:hypothetical protein
MPKMSADPERIKAPKPVPAGWYQLKLVGFRPKLSSKKDSVNFNPMFEVVNSKAEYNGSRVYENLNTKFDRQHVDFAHGFGFPLNPDASLPGDWVPDPSDKDNVEKMQYKGPLLGKICEAELVVSTYQGNESNKIRQIKCRLDGCATKFPDVKHLTNWIGKDKAAA